MTKRMLIDANHPEETRVVILDGSKVEEFDFEAASKRPLIASTYLRNTCLPQGLYRSAGLQLTLGRLPLLRSRRLIQQIPARLRRG